MPVTEHDLPALFEAHSSRDDSLRADATVRLAQLNRRVRVIRRRRTAGAVCAVVVAALAIAVLPTWLSRGSSDSLPAVRQRVADGSLPRYADGGRAIGDASFRSEETKTASLTFTPTSWKLSLAEVCAATHPSDDDNARALETTYSVNGHETSSGGCGGGATFSASSGEDEEYWRALGVRLGEPSLIEARVRRTEPATYVGTLPPVRVGFALYQQIPRATYPLPPRPTHLDPMPAWNPDPRQGRVVAEVNAIDVRARGDAELATTTLPEDGLNVDLRAGAPGELTVLVNGIAVHEWSTWTWSGSQFGDVPITVESLRDRGLTVAAGDEVTVQIRAAYFDDPRWGARLQQGTGT